MTEDELIAKFLTPKAAEHWATTEKNRAVYGDRDCRCPLCDTMPHLLAVFREHTAPTGDEREALARIIDPAIYSDINRLTGDGWAASLRAADAILSVFRLVRRGEADDYDAGYAEGFHHGLSSPRGRASDDRGEAESDERGASRRAWGEFQLTEDYNLIPMHCAGYAMAAFQAGHSAGFRRGAPAEPAEERKQVEVTDEAKKRAVEDLFRRYGASNGSHAWVEFQGDPHFIVNQVVAALEERGKP